MPISTSFKWLSATIILLLTSALFAPTSFAAISSLEDFNGKIQNLDDYTGKGKWTIVMMWASDCHVCNQEANEYVKFHEKHQNKDATVIGISLDGAQKKSDAEAFLKKHAINFPSLIGEPGTVSNMFTELTGGNFRGTPTFLFFSPGGELRALQVGAVPTDMIEKFMVSEAALIKEEQKQ